MNNKYHILMDFVYSDIKYVIYTDDTDRIRTYNPEDAP